jgi:16S rRNA processing protein RimM
MNLIPVGKLQKTFGANGELLLAMYGDSPKLLQETPVLIIIDGLDVPFYFKSIAEKNGRLVVIFDDMEREALAQELVGREVFVEDMAKSKAAAPPAESEALIGYTFVEATFGVVGKLTQRLDYPGNPVLLLATEQGKEILIPDNPRFVTSVDEKKKIVNVDLPEGLIDIYLEPAK